MELQLLVLSVLFLAAFSSAEVLSSGGCDNAVHVPAPYEGQVVFGDIRKTATYSNRCGLDSSGGTYFFTISPEPNLPMNVSTCHADTTFNTVMAVYRGNECGSLSCVAYNNRTSCDETRSASSIEFIPEGGDYWIMVAGYGTSEGVFELSFKQESSTVHSCASATTIHGPFTKSVTVFDFLSGNATSGDQPCGVDSSMAGKWYLIYPTRGATVTVTTCSDYFEFDTVLAVLVGDSCDELQCVDSNDDNCQAYSTLSTVVFGANESPYYYVYVTGFGSHSGSYYLTISEVPSASPSPTPRPHSCNAVDVEYEGRCYYLDGSGGSCLSGYTMAPQSILSSIANMFIGLNYRTSVSDNCCILHSQESSEGEDWGFGSDQCNYAGPFVSAPYQGGSGCTNADNHSSRQLTLCESV